MKPPTRTRYLRALGHYQKRTTELALHNPPSKYPKEPPNDAWRNWRILNYRLKEILAGRPDPNTVKPKP